MNIKMEKFEYNHTIQLGGEVFHVREMLPRLEKEQMAQDVVNATMVFDEDSGIAYDSYNSELIRVFLILAHYTDLDLSAYDTPEGRYEIYDILATNGLLREIMDIVEYDMDDVESIMHKVQCAAKRDFETKHSLGYRVGKAFESLLGTENLTETVAKAEKLNSKLIDMLAAVQNQLSAVAGSGLQFARKD